MMKQFVAQEVCLKCQGCCRFKEADSVWSPCLLEEEIQELLDKDIPPASISIDRRLRPIPDPGKEGFICPFLNPADNKCRIYESRPFECLLYPFLFCLRNKKARITVDLNCPYAKEKINSQEFKQYSEYLAAYLNTPEQIKVLKDNPQILQAYEDVLDILEVEI